MEGGDAEGKKRKGVVVWADGCYDMMHFGHANSLRQAKEMGDYLIVGVHSDADIARHKGPPVMHEDERYESVRSCKWVDEVVEASPYVTDWDFIEKFGVAFVVHGDDITTDENGVDTYKAIKDSGRYRECKRTPGVSTTDLVGRMLLMTKSPTEKADAAKSAAANPGSKYTGVSQFLPTSRKIKQFSSAKEPKAGDKVVYICGAFDLFNIGHIMALKAASELGDYLIVGIHGDDEVMKVRGAGNPLCNIHERTLGVLQCKYVDEVVIGTPYEVTSALLEDLNVDLVAHGSTDIVTMPDGTNPYLEAIEAGKFTRFSSQSSITTSEIVQRILMNLSAFHERNRLKVAKEIRVQDAEARRQKEAAQSTQ
eukprot:m.160692 g.160692  ORF g.160692 m.160692 type:complete len:367 (+) comp23805_c1_seq1:407-1507(+)